MKKKVFFSLMAVVPLFVFSCSKSVIEPETVATKEVESDPWNIVPMEMHFVGNGDLKVNADYSADTKSQTSMNGTGTYASVLWTAGDEILMADEAFNYTTYIASASGAKVSFEGGEVLSGGPYNCIYPATCIKAHNIYNSKPIYGLYIPQEQAATVGSVAEEANVSFTQVATQEEELHFKNVGAIVKFKLSGDVVSSVKKVTLGGTDPISGTFVVTPSDEGAPQFITNISFTGLPQFTNVSLTGNFEAGKDYYMVVAPGVHDSFYMSFENNDGTQSTKKFSSKVMTFNQTRITDFGTINLGDDFDHSLDPILYIEHTTAKYATIAVIPDGYRAEELDQYVVDAQSGIDALFNTEPYKSYKGYFNVWILRVASKESGARISDGTTEEKNRDCYFQTSWGKSSYDDMQANANRVFGFVEENCPDIVNGIHSIVEVPVLIIVNDTRYGGIAWNYGNGATYCLVPKSYGGSYIHWGYPNVEAASSTALPVDTREVTQEEKTDMGIGYNGTWRNTLVHEFGGHSIGKLGDEYWYSSYKSAVEAIAQHSWAVPMMLNVSAKSDPALVPWADMYDISAQDKMAAISPKYNERIGVFQGADVSMFNRWRSEKISCMIDNRFYFSTWQRYIIVNRIMTLSRLAPIDFLTFLDNDNPTDPVRDGGSPVMQAQGVIDIAPAHEAPMLPPPMYAEWKY